VALADIHLCFTLALRALGWLWWRAWTGLVAGDAAALWMAGLAGVALGDIHLHFCVAGVALRALGWLWWCAWTGLVAGDAAALCVAGVAGMALGDNHIRFTWQAWHLVTSIFVLRGRRGT